MANSDRRRRLRINVPRADLQDGASNPVTSASNATTLPNPGGAGARPPGPKGGASGPLAGAAERRAAGAMGKAPSMIWNRVPPSEIPIRQCGPKLAQDGKATWPSLGAAQGHRLGGPPRLPAFGDAEFPQV